MTRHERREADDDHHEEAHFPTHGAARHGRDDGAAVPGRHGAREHAAGQDGGRGEDPPLRASNRCTVRPAAPRSALEKNMWSPAAVGRSFDLSPTSLSPLEPYRDYLTIVSQHRRAQCRSLRAERDRRRSLPLERGVPHPGAPQADRRLRRASRAVDRSALRAEVRAGHGDPLDAAVRSRTSTRPAAVPTGMRASTPTRSAGPMPRRRCR